MWTSESLWFLFQELRETAKEGSRGQLRATENALWIGKRTGAATDGFSATKGPRPGTQRRE
jgi:hypothetical protein